jgi:two-component system, chemotaxis family, response regulator PixG
MITSSSIRSLHPRQITKWQLVTVVELLDKMQTFSQNQFTGRLDLNIENSSEQQWSIYFSLGNLIWARGTLHSLRRWCRQLVRHCPQVFVGQKSYLSNCPDYDLLAQLLKQGKIKKYEMEAVIEGQILEILFDIIQLRIRLDQRSGEQLTYRVITVDSIDSKLYMMPTDHALLEAQKLWDTWKRAGLEKYSPNLAPTILKAEKLQEQTSEIVYRNLTIYADGTQTLRDLSVKMNRNLLFLTKPIKSYIEQGLIGLTKVEDIRCFIQTITNANERFIQGKQVESSSTSAVANKVSFQSSNSRLVSDDKTQDLKESDFLVACIDDSKLDSLRMNKILSETNYRFISIQDPVQALPILLENKPDLIFLDLVMPIANGYEICTQIRRVSMFKDTPIIILTSNDGIVDRMRSKIVGASSFLAKPINYEKVTTTIQKHLITSSKYNTQAAISNDFERNLKPHKLG